MVLGAVSCLIWGLFLSEILLVLCFPCLAQTQEVVSTWDWLGGSISPKGGMEKAWGEGCKPCWNPSGGLQRCWDAKWWPEGGRGVSVAQAGLKRGQLQALAILKKDLQPKAGLTGELPSGTTCWTSIIAWAFKKIEIHLSVQVGLLLGGESWGKQQNKYWGFAKQR